jgi:hypothetical protein
MKKITLLIVAFFTVTFIYAGNADLFSIDEQELNSEFAELTALEEFVQTNDMMSLEEIITTNSFDLTSFNLNSFGASSQDAEFAFRWEGFLWGFLCCPIGFFVVAVNKNKDHDQKLSFWIGVAASSVINIIYYAATPHYYY